MTSARGKRDELDGKGKVWSGKVQREQIVLRDVADAQRDLRGHRCEFVRQKSARAISQRTQQKDNRNPIRCCLTEVVLSFTGLLAVASYHTIINRYLPWRYC